jgi:hypothetical protein
LLVAQRGLSSYSGGLEALEYTDVPTPIPGNVEVLV